MQSRFESLLPSQLFFPHYPRDLNDLRRALIPHHRSIRNRNFTALSVNFGTPQTNGGQTGRGLESNESGGLRIRRSGVAISPGALSFFTHIPRENQYFVYSGPKIG